MLEAKPAHSGVGCTPLDCAHPVATVLEAPSSPYRRGDAVYHFADGRRLLSRRLRLRLQRTRSCRWVRCLLVRIVRDKVVKVGGWANKEVNAWLLLHVRFAECGRRAEPDTASEQSASNCGTFKMLNKCAPTKGG